MSADAKKIMKLYDTLVAQRQNFDNLFQQVTDFVLPYHATVNNRPTFAGQRRGATRYDSTAADAAEKLASNLGTTLTNPSLRWFDLVMEDQRTNQLPGVGEWLESVRDIMNNELAGSNFYTRIDEAWLSVVGYGNALLFVDEQRVGETFDRLRFNTWAIREYVTLENENGFIDGAIRKFTMTANQAKAEFEGRPGFQSLGKTVSQLVESGTERADTEQIEFLHLIRPRKDRDVGSLRGDEMPFESVYLEVKEKHIVIEWGFAELPFAAMRWRKNADDKGYGRGPGLNAMPDIQSLNEFQRLTLKALAKDVDPPLQVEHKGVIGSVRTRPGGLNHLRRGSEIRPLVSNRNLQFSELERERLENRVRQMFFAEQIDVLMGDPTPNMTAFEFSKRIGFMRQLLGSTFGRLQTEGLDPTISRVFGILSRNGKFPDPPESLLEIGGTVKIEYVGPLARAQRFEEIEAIQAGTAFAAQLAEATQDPAPLDTIHAEKAQRQVNKLLGVPSDVTRDEDEVAERVEQRRQAQAAQQALVEAEQVADVAATASNVA